MAIMAIIASLSGCGPAVSVSESAGTDAGSGSAGSDASGTQSTSGGPGTTTTTTETGTGLTTTVTSAGVTSMGSDDTTATTDHGTTHAGSTGALACDGGDGYRAAMIIGGVDRIRLFFRNDAASTCTWLTLAWNPGGGSPYAATATDPWTLETAAWNNVPEACDDDFPGKLGENYIPDAVGTIDLEQPSPQQPCSIAVDVQLQLLENPDPPVFVDFCHPMLTVGDCLLP
jgi:hypothetical protein